MTAAVTTLTRTRSTCAGRSHSRQARHVNTESSSGRRRAPGLTNTASVAGTQPDQNAGEQQRFRGFMFVSSYAPCASPTFRGPYVSPLNTTSTGTRGDGRLQRRHVPRRVLRSRPTAISCCSLATATEDSRNRNTFEENNPVGGITADFNNDGHADVAAISQNNSAFQQPAEFGSGSAMARATSLAVGRHIPATGGSVRHRDWRFQSRRQC